MTLDEKTSVALIAAGYRVLISDDPVATMNRSVAEIYADASDRGDAAYRLSLVFAGMLRGHRLAMALLPDETKTIIAAELRKVSDELQFRAISDGLEL